MNQRQTNLGSGNVGKLLFSLALPTITSQIVNMLYNLVDRVYIGHMQPADTVGKLALTGVGPWAAHLGPLFRRERAMRRNPNGSWETA